MHGTSGNADNGFYRAISMPVRAVFGTGASAKALNRNVKCRPNVGFVALSIEHMRIARLHVHHMTSTSERGACVRKWQ